MLRRLPTLSQPLARGAVRPAVRMPQVFPQARHASSFGTSRPGRCIGTTFALGTGAILLAYYYDARSAVHEHVIMPVLRAVMDPEEGHKLAVRMLSAPSWARPADTGIDGPELHTELMGMPVVNPIGVAAGFDKDAQCIDGLFDLGFGYVEVGSVTPQPQAGNDLPRFFRLDEDQAAINRYGFNSKGHGHALSELRKRLVKFSQEHPDVFPSPLPAVPVPPAGLPRSLRPGHLLAVNLGKNKTSEADSDADYVKGVRTLGPYADIVVINVSSPNTPGLRALQSGDKLERLLGDVVAARNAIVVDGLPKIAVKVTCDLSEDELADVASAVRKTGVDGVIVSNTTIRRKGMGLKSENAMETGGLSGRPLFPFALNALLTLRPLLPPNVPIIGAGGIWDGTDALAMARAGASLVQVYTAFGFRGVGLARLIKDEISGLLGVSHSTWAEQVGKEHDAADMGWDEGRVASEGARVRAEAAGLSTLLDEIRDKEEIGRLVSEAHSAILHLETVKELEARSAAREEVADASGAPSAPVLAAIAEEQGGGADAAIVDAAAKGSVDAIAHDPRAELVVVPSEPEQRKSIGEVAEAVEALAKRTPGDKWADEVHQGSKRLV